MNQLVGLEQGINARPLPRRGHTTGRSCSSPSLLCSYWPWTRKKFARCVAVPRVCRSFGMIRRASIAVVEARGSICPFRVDGDHRASI